MPPCSGAAMRKAQRMRENEESEFFRNATKKERWWESPRWVGHRVQTPRLAAAALIDGWADGSGGILALGEALFITMRECKRKDWESNVIIDELNSAGESGRALATHLRTKQPSTWKRYMSDMHRLCWWISGEHIRSLRAVTEKTVMDQLNTAIGVDCTASMIDGLKHAWVNLLEMTHPRMMESTRIKALIKAHKREAAAAPQKAYPMELEYLLRVERDLLPNFSMNDKVVFAYILHLYLGCARFEHFADARWSELSVQQAMGLTALVLRHPRGQKQSDATVRIQTVTVDGKPSLLALLNEIAEAQPEDWPFIYGVRGSKGEMRQMELIRVNDRIKRWMRLTGHSNYNEFSSHSGRRGAATEAYRMGVDESVIQHAGKW